MLLTLLGSGTAALAAPTSPDPSPGRWAPTSVALLHYNRDLCETIAANVKEQWRKRGENDGAEQAVRDWVLREEMSDLTAARAAGALIRRFLPQARNEAGFETGASLERLFDLQTRLCDTVALPTAPRGAFESKVGDLSTRIAREEAELGRLLVTDDADLQSALEPYLLPIQLAGIEAEGELVDYLESLRPKPRPPTVQELMAAWYKTYSTKVQPAKTLLGHYLASRHAGDRKAIGRTCRDLSKTIVPILADRQIFSPPDSRAGDPLRQAYRELQSMARACAAGEFQQVDERFSAMHTQLEIAARRLAPYSVTP